MHRIKKGSNFAPQLRDKPLHNEPRKLTAKAVPEMQNNDDSLAQLVEHNTFNVGVLGSNPRRITLGSQILTARATQSGGSFRIYTFDFKHLAILAIAYC